jgi:biotin-dependent carboxylase-like uncharacterized protein
MDRRALALANALVGNPPDAAALEVAFGGAVFRAEGGPLLVAAVGPGVTLEVGGRTLAAMRSARAEAGDRIVLGPVRGGMFAYVAVAGGLLMPVDLGSRAFHARSGIGGPPLRPDTRLPCADRPEAAERQLADPVPDDTGPIRYVPGPQEHRFTEAARAAFRTARYEVAARSDRMGLRLAGQGLEHVSGHDIVSDGVVPGSVQVPGDGQPIVLMRDCQTTGGYPKIGTVISADLDRLAQCPPGHAIFFTSVTQTEAIAAARARAAEIARLCAAVRSVPRSDDSAFLLSQNLIGGVVSGAED